MKHYRSLCGLYSIHQDTYNTPNDLVKHELHNHNQYELYYLKKGRIEYNIECESYDVNAGDAVIVNYHEYHKITVLDPDVYERIVIQMDEIFLRKMVLDFDLFSFFRSKPIGKNNLIPSAVVKAQGLDVLFEKLNVLTEPSKENDLVIKCTLIEMMIVLRKIYKKTLEVVESGRVNNIHKNIVEFIHNNLDKNLTLDIIAKEFFLTKYYLCHEFKKALGISIKDYIITKRILLANNLIKQGTSATEACYKTGFNSYPNFYRAFLKVLKHSPTSEASANKVKQEKQ